MATEEYSDQREKDIKGTGKLEIPRFSLSKSAFARRKFCSLIR